MHTKQYKEGALTYSIRHMSKEEYDREFPDSEEEQETPSTDVDEDPEENETASQLVDAFKRVVNGKSAVRTVQVTEPKVNATAPEPTRTPNATSEALAKVIQRLRDSA